MTLSASDSRADVSRRASRTSPELAEPMDDTHLNRALAGDEAAFVLLYRHIHPGLVRYLRVLVGQAAEDVAAETWAQACRDLHRFDGGLPAFRAWIARIGRNRALDHLRKERRHPVTVLPTMELPEPGRVEAAETAAETAVATREALNMIASLPKDQAEAVLLRAVMGLDAASAGAVLGKRPGAVRTAAYRGLRTLSARLRAGGAGAAADGGRHPDGDTQNPSDAEGVS